MPGTGRPGSRKRERLSFWEASIRPVIIDNYYSSIIAGLLRSIPRRGGDLRISSPAFFADQSTPRERLGGFGFIDTTPKFFPGSFFGVLQYICRADVFVADLIFHPSKLSPFFRRINIQRFHCRLLKVRYDLYRSNAFQKGMACAKSQRFALCISQWRLF